LTKGAEGPQWTKCFQILWILFIFVFWRNKRESVSTPGYNYWLSETTQWTIYVRSFWREVISFSPNNHPKMVLQSKVFRIIFLFWVVYFIFVFLKNKRERGSLKEGRRPHEPKVYRFSFYFGLFIFSLFFRRTREKGVSLKEGLRPPWTKGFADYLFILGCLFYLRFLEEQERKGFL